MKKHISFLLCMLVLPLFLRAQEAEDSLTIKNLDSRYEFLESLESKLNWLKKIHFSGFYQFQYEYGGKDAVLNIGNSRTETPGEAFSRFGIRRGRLRFTYSSNLITLIYHIDMTENAIGIRDAFIDLSDPWYRTSFVRVGVFFRPFGHEIAFPSSRRETPERATIFRLLFPQDRDMGAMVLLQAPETSKWRLFRFEGAMIAGNGINRESDSRRDFIGHLTASKDFDYMSWRLGASYYRGSVFQGNENVFTMRDNVFVLNQSESNIGRYAKREYMGIEGEFSYQTAIGRTIVRAEYLWGQQPARLESSESPSTSILPWFDTYIRSVDGGYVYFIQHIAKSPLLVVFKYDWYNPNTKVRDDQIGLPGSYTSATDLWRNTFGFGTQWEMNNTFSLMAYYEFKNNEKTINIPGFDKNLDDNVLTLRLQCRF